MCSLLHKIRGVSLLLLERLLERPEDPLLFFWFLQRYLAGLELVSQVVDERKGLLLCFREVCVEKQAVSVRDVTKRTTNYTCQRPCMRLVRIE